MPRAGLVNSSPVGAAGWGVPTLAAPGLAMPADAGLTYANEPCCGVVVVAAAAGVPLATAWAMLAEFHGPGWRGMTTVVERCCVLYALGVRWQHRVMNRPTTVRVWDRDVSVPGRTCVVAAANHVMLIRDGLVLDQRGILPVELHWCRNRIVRDIFVLREPP